MTVKLQDHLGKKDLPQLIYNYIITIMYNVKFGNLRNTNFRAFLRTISRRVTSSVIVNFRNTAFSGCHNIGGTALVLKGYGILKLLDNCIRTM